METNLNILQQVGDKLRIIPVENCDTECVIPRELLTDVNDYKELFQIVEDKKVKFTVYKHLNNNKFYIQPVDVEAKLELSKDGYIEFIESFTSTKKL